MIFRIDGSENHMLLLVRLVKFVLQLTKRKDTIAFMISFKEWKIHVSISRVSFGECVFK